MPKGGARNRSGPSPDPNSITSARRGLTFEVLDVAGFDGEVPEFPLPPVRILRWEWEDKRKFQVHDSDASERFADREAALWEWAWRTPQAHAWAAEPWRHHTVAMWVRTATVCEGSEASAADKNSLHRFADQIGFTPAGLKENGWSIGSPIPRDDADDGPAGDDPRSRLTVVAGGVA